MYHNNFIRLKEQLKCTEVYSKVSTDLKIGQLLSDNYKAKTKIFYDKLFL